MPASSSTRASSRSPARACTRSWTWACGGRPRQACRCRWSAARGGRATVSAAWARGWALIVLGHSDCGTTRLTLPFVDRIHRRRPPIATAVAVLQDGVADARALVEELALELPVRLDEEPYPLAAK